MEISRAELYRLVCEAPLSKVAPRFGVSAAKLAGICWQYNIPYPGSTHWTLLSMGKPVEAFSPLPADSEADARPINIEPIKPRRKKPSTTAGLPDDQSEGVASQQKADLHPLIVARVSRYEEWQRKAQESESSWHFENPAPLSETDHRQYRVTSQFLRMIESRGATVSEGENGDLRATINGETIDFRLREIMRETHEWSKDRRAAERKMVGTGKLRFIIRTYLRGKHDERWSESALSSMESRLPEISDRFFEGAQILKAWRQELADAEEARRQARAQREERERLAKIELNRIQKLLDSTGDWRAANELRAFIAELRSGELDLTQEIKGKTVAEWLTWAEGVANELDMTRTGAAGLFRKISDDDE